MFGKNFRLMFLAIVLGAALSSPAWGQVADRDISGTELCNFDGFLDSHSSIQRDLNQNPAALFGPIAAGIAARIGVTATEIGIVTGSAGATAGAMATTTVTTASVIVTVDDRRRDRDHDRDRQHDRD